MRKTRAGAPQATPMPAPALAERDEDGRLVGLRLDGHRPWPALEDNSWLVGVDGSAPSLRAAGEAARLAGLTAHGAVQLVHVQPWLAKEAAEAELAQRGWEISAPARALLEAAGLPWRLHVAMGEPAERIVALSQRLGVRGVAVGSQGLGATESVLLGSVAYKLIHLSRAPLLVVR